MCMLVALNRSLMRATRLSKLTPAAGGGVGAECDEEAGGQARMRREKEEEWEEKGEDGT